MESHGFLEAATTATRALGGKVARTEVLESRSADDIFHGRGASPELFIVVFLRVLTKQNFRTRTETWNVPVNSRHIPAATISLSAGQSGAGRGVGGGDVQSSLTVAPVTDGAVILVVVVTLQCVRVP